jgi:hypothetical protein
VQADEAADRVRRLDVDVERDIHGRADRGDLGEAEVGGEVRDERTRV